MMSPRGLVSMGMHGAVGWTVSDNDIYVRAFCTETRGAKNQKVFLIIGWVEWVCVCGGGVCG